MNLLRKQNNNLSPQNFKIPFEGNDWILTLIQEIDIIKITFFNKLDLPNSIYESIYSFEELITNFKILSIYDDLEDIYLFIFQRISESKFMILKDNFNYKFILLSPMVKTPNVILLLKPKILNLSIEYPSTIEEFINILKECQYLRSEIQSLKNENKRLKNELEKRREKERKTKLIELNLSDYKEGFRSNSSKNIFQNNNIENNLKNMSLYLTITNHSDSVNYLSVFPSGKFISVSSDNSIKIFGSISKKLILSIENAHQSSITCIAIIDEDNFLTSSTDKTIKKWNISNNNYSLLETLTQHNNRINKIIYQNNTNILSCSSDKTICIWVKSNKNPYKYFCYQKLINQYTIESMLDVENNNLITCSIEGDFKYWNLNSFSVIFSLNNIYCANCNALSSISKDLFLVGGGYDGIMKIISLSKKIVVYEIDNKSQVFCILILSSGYIITGGEDKIIRIYQNNTYQLIHSITNTHEDEILGLTLLKQGFIASYSDDSTIKLWKY
jgi:WD40 repeat protein